MSKEMTSLVSHLIETIDNGQFGLAEAAMRLGERGHPEMAATFAQLGRERESFGEQLRVLNSEADQDANDAGTAPGRIHRGWIAISDAITGDSPVAVLKNIVEGEAHAITEYEDALEAELSSDVRPVVELQLVAVKASHKLAAALLAQSQVTKRP
ncbi:MAG: PA2169 family four-helix-bundle protein [Ilumatobacteraceae bacterium]